MYIQVGERTTRLLFYNINSFHFWYLQIKNNFNWFLFALQFNLQSLLILTQVCVMLRVCEASASDVSVIVSAYDGVRPQPRGSSHWREQQAEPGRMGAPSQGKWLSSSWARGHWGSLPPIATVCTPWALPSGQRQNAHKHTRVHTHLELGTWKELSDHRMPPHLRPDLGPKQTRKTKRALIQTILLALLPWNGT